jgi:predicted esterase
MNADQIDLIGFSQGAALSYTLALLPSERIRVLAVLSVFLPTEAGHYDPSGTGAQIRGAAGGFGSAGYILRI